MITPQQAEALANKTVQDYVNACGCGDTQDVANVLMKLASMCGLAMAAVVGRDESVDRLIGTAMHIQATQPAAPWKMERAN